LLHYVLPMKRKVSQALQKAKELEQKEPSLERLEQEEREFTRDRKKLQRAVEENFRR